MNQKTPLSSLEENIQRLANGMNQLCEVCDLQNQQIVKLSKFALELADRVALLEQKVSDAAS